MELEYLNYLKTQGNWTFQHLSEVSGIPESTIRKIFSGSTENPAIDTITCLVIAMGGSLDELTGIQHPENLQDEEQDAEQDAIETMNRIRLEMLEAQREAYEQQIKKIEEAAEKSDAYKTRIIRILFIAFCFVLLFILAILVYDVVNRDVGWFRSIYNHTTSFDFDSTLSSILHGEVH